MTFDNIGWFVYLWTRLDALTGIMVFFLVVSTIGTLGVLFTRFCMWMDSIEGDDYTLSTWFKRFMIVFVCSLLTLVVLPSKDDALLIAGVVVGAQVAEKTISTVSESEMTGKVFQIVTERVDSELNKFLVKDKGATE